LDRSLAAVKARGELEDSLPLAARERILTMTRDNRGRWIAARDRALYYCRRELKRTPVSEEWIRLGWEQLARVLWDENLERLTLFGLLPTVPRQTVLDLRTGAAMSELARERIQTTAIVRTVLKLPGHGTARVVDRRIPGSDALVWLVGLDNSAEIDGTGLNEALEAALKDLRAQLGV
jgi:hypothetical protein